MNAVYYHSPYWLKIVLASLAAYHKKHQKYGKYFKEYFKFLINSQVELQVSRAEEEMHTFLKWVKQNIPVYDVTSDFTPFKMPLIDKSWVLKNYAHLTKKKPFKIVKSSGSTGQPLAVPYNIQAYQKEYAFWWYHRSFGNVQIGERIATFSGHKVTYINKDVPPFWVMNYVENQLIFSSYHLSIKNLKFYILKLQKFKPNLIHGYPSSVYLLAKYILENNIRLEFQPKMIITASETTLDFQKQVIENAFGCKNYIWYGNTEYAGHITECPNGKLHVQPYHSFVRIINEEGMDVLPGEEGYIVATNFTNTALPLINYNTRDIVRLSKNQQCSCGKGGKIVDYIIGRIEDYIITPDGRYVGRLDHLFKDAKYIRNAQIEQRKLNELIIRIEKEDKYSNKIESIILKEARKRVGNDMEIVFEYVSEIPKEQNGKFKFVIQKMNIKDLKLEKVFL
jgi:phenylacetate-CoA ligase